MPQTTRMSALVAGSRVRAGLQRGGQLARPRWLTTPRPTHLSTLAAGSSVIDFSFTMVINSAVDNYCLTYQVKSIHYIFILHVALFEIAITLACKFSNAGQVVYCKRDYYITKLLNDSYRFISRSNMENLKTTPRVALRLRGYDDLTQ